MTAVDPERTPYVDEKHLRQASAKSEVTVDNGDKVLHPCATFKDPQQELSSLNEEIRKRAVERYKKVLARTMYPYGYDFVWHNILDKEGRPVKGAGVSGGASMLKDVLWKKALKHAYKKTSGGKYKGPAIVRPVGVKARKFYDKYIQRATGSGLYITATGIEPRGFAARGLDARGINPRGGTVLGTIAAIAAPLAIKGLTELGKYIYSKYKEHKAKKSGSGAMDVQNKAAGAGEVPTQYQMEQAMKAAAEAQKRGMVGFPNPLSYPKYPYTGGGNVMDMFRDVYSHARNMIYEIASKADMPVKRVIPFVEKFIHRQAKRTLGKGAAEKILYTRRVSKPFKYPINLKQIMKPLARLSISDPKKWAEWNRYFEGKEIYPPGFVQRRGEKYQKEMEKYRDSKKKPDDKLKGPDKEEPEKILEQCYDEEEDEPSPEEPTTDEGWTVESFLKALKRRVTGSGIADIVSSLASIIGGMDIPFLSSLPLGDAFKSITSFLSEQIPKIIPVAKDIVMPVIKSAQDKLLSAFFEKPDDTLFRRVMEESKEAMKEAAKDIAKEGKKVPFDLPEPETEWGTETLEEEGSGLRIRKKRVGKEIVTAGAWFSEYLPYALTLGSQAIPSIVSWLSGKAHVPISTEAAKNIGQAVGDIGRMETYKRMMNPPIDNAMIAKLQQEAELGRRLGLALQTMTANPLDAQSYVSEMKHAMTRGRPGVIGAPAGAAQSGERTLRAQLEKAYGITSDPYGTRLPAPARALEKVLEEPFIMKTKAEKEAEKIEKKRVEREFGEETEAAEEPEASTSKEKHAKPEKARAEQTAPLSEGAKVSVRDIESTEAPVQPRYQMRTRLTDRPLTEKEKIADALTGMARLVQDARRKLNVIAPAEGSTLVEEKTSHYIYDAWLVKLLNDIIREKTQTEEFPDYEPRFTLDQLREFETALPAGIREIRSWNLDTSDPELMPDPRKVMKKLMKNEDTLVRVEPTLEEVLGMKGKEEKRSTGEGMKRSRKKTVAGKLCAGSRPMPTITTITATMPDTKNMRRVPKYKGLGFISLGPTSADVRGGKMAGRVLMFSKKTPARR